MPYSKEHKRRSRQRIVENAARAFRAAGVYGVGVDAVMGQAGLTHGAFYAHFHSKDDLIAEACAYGLATQAERMARRAAKVAPGNVVAAITDFYLSPAHRDAPADGCMIPTLSAEIARAPEATRSAFTEALRAYLRRVAAFLPSAPSVSNSTDPTAGPAEADGSTHVHADSDGEMTQAAQAAQAGGEPTPTQEQMDSAIALFATLAGGILLARATNDLALSDHILTTTRAFANHAFGADALPTS